jgi:hypothetical protein
MGLKWPSGGYEPWLWGFISLLFVIAIWFGVAP